MLSSMVYWIASGVLYYAERDAKKYTPELTKEVKEDLLAEVQRLRAENACLKNLVLERAPPGEKPR